MSLKSTKSQLEQLLADADNKVIALSGKWGTGKSFMWNEVKSSSPDEAIKGALYASLFGQSSMDQVKMRLIQSALNAAKTHPAAWDSAKKFVSAGIKVAEGFHKGFGALNDVGLVLAPGILRQKLIVLDDIERKHEKLNVDEILGFIDDFSNQFNARFLLILNSDQLDRRGVWDTLREKVIDQELNLDTSSDEAFDIAIAATPSIYGDHIRSTITICKITNIRIIRKIIKVINRILIDYQNLSDAVLLRVIPSTVLLSGIHYKGIDDGPDFDFLLSQGLNEWGSFGDDKKQKTDDELRKSRWSLLINEIGIYGCDKYELLVIELLQSGLFDTSKVSEIIESYIAHNDVMVAQAVCKNFLQNVDWNYTSTEAELLVEGSLVAQSAHLLNAHIVTELYDALESIPGGITIANNAINCWLEAFRRKSIKAIDFSDFSYQKIASQIKSEFDLINSQAQSDTSVLEACLYIAANSGWGTRQEIALRSATVKDMEMTIRNSRIADFRAFMFKMIDLCIRKEQYIPHFGSAMDAFIEACRNIVQDASSERLGKIIKDKFQVYNLQNLLDNEA